MVTIADLIANGKESCGWKVKHSLTKCIGYSLDFRMRDGQPCGDVGIINNQIGFVYFDQSDGIWHLSSAYPGNLEVIAGGEKILLKDGKLYSIGECCCWNYDHENEAIFKLEPLLPAPPAVPEFYEKAKVLLTTDEKKWLEEWEQRCTLIYASDLASFLAAPAWKVFLTPLAATMGSWWKWWKNEHKDGKWSLGNQGETCPNCALFHHPAVIVNRTIVGHAWCDPEKCGIPKCGYSGSPWKIASLNADKQPLLAALKNAINRLAGERKTEMQGAFQKPALPDMKQVLKDLVNAIRTGSFYPKVKQAVEAAEKWLEEKK